MQERPCEGKFWYDKPWDVARQGEILTRLMERVIKSTMEPENIVRMTGDYNRVLGPDVGTCVCVLRTGCEYGSGAASARTIKYYQM